jgi:PIN domain nuclease of toxin-antitoxin system
LIFLDTHVVAWLYGAAAAKLPPVVRSKLDQEDLYVSPIIELELEYLYEIGRLKQPAATVLAYLADRVGLQVDETPFHNVVRAAVDQTWTRDPFDRLIVGQAALTQQPLVSKDRLIRAHYEHTFWQDSGVELGPE